MSVVIDGTTGINTPSLSFNGSEFQPGTQTFVATGTIPDGSLVGLNPDGTVSVVSALTGGTYVQNSVTGGNGQTYGVYIASCYDSVNNKVFLAYANVQIVVIVGTISGNTITFGSPSGTGLYNYGSQFGMTYDTANNRLVVGLGKIGVVSGTNITWTNFTWPASFTSCDSVSFDASNGKVLFSGRNSSNFPCAAVGTISGTSISYGSTVVLSSSAANVTCISASGGKVVAVACTNPSMSVYAGTVSGTSLSFGAASTFTSDYVRFASVAYNQSAEKFVLTWENYSSNTIPFTPIVAGSVSGTTVTLGSFYSLSDASKFRPSVTYDTASSEFFVSYGGTLGRCTVVGTTVAVSVILTKSVPFGGQNTLTGMGGGKVLHAVSDPLPTVPSSGLVYSNTTEFVVNATSTLPNFVGVAAEAIANGEEGSVTIAGGVNTSQTGLTEGASYSISSNTGLLVAGSVENKIGYAISPTELYITAGGL